ncbi:MAG: hypothetical protein IJL88_04990 [Clostridia bacterium]|nr:hypothetical protein [Clostridia bacterium]
MLKKGLLSLLAVICLLLPAAALGEWMSVAQNERFILNYDPAESQIMLQDLTTGAEWRSTPANIADDKIASGMNKINRQSDLLITYHNPTYVTNQVNSYTGSIKNGDFTWTQIENGVEIRYFFPKQGFLIPVRYELEKDCLKASVITGEIQEDLWSLSDDPETVAKAANNKEKLSVMTISLLPFMGAADTQDQGYLILPDGSGALMHFNNGRGNTAFYQQDVFGRDATLSVKRAATRTYQLNMPLFGMIKNGLGMMAVVENGEYQAQLNAAIAGQLTGYNNAYFTVTYINMESNTLMAGSNSSKTVTLAANTFRDMGDFTVRYYLLDKQDADYTDIASLYRSQLGLRDLQADEAPVVQVKMIGSIPSIKTFIGIPYNSVTVLTSYKDAGKVLDDFHASGVDRLSLQYIGWSKQSVRGKIVTGLELDNRLDGKSGFDQLMKSADAAGDQVSLTVDLVNLYKNGNGYWSLFSAANNINSTARQMNEYLMSTGVKDPAGKTWYLLRPDKVVEASERAASGLSGQKYGLTLNALGNTVYSSLGKNGISRTQAGKYWRSALEKLSQNIPWLAAEKPNAYAFPFIRQADDVPLASSRYDVIDEDIPFYQLVTHGAFIMYSEPLNEWGSLDDAILRLAEYGVYPSWRLIARDPALLSGTDGADWYSTSLSAWYDDVIDVDVRLKELGRYAAMRMVSHERPAKDVSVTTYENGDRVYVNYGLKDVTVQNVTIPARSFTIKEVD